MSPIKVGIIGLSAGAKTSWAANAHLPYLKSYQSKYAITALCNSSVAAANTAIEAFDLPASTKAYGTPEDLADDPNVELVVCNTRVDVHYETIRPSLLKGKQVYCEWPLAQNSEAATELANMAKEKRSRSMNGLQGQVSPITLQVKSLIEAGRIGKFLSSTVVMFGGSRSRDTLAEGLRYFTQKEVDIVGMDGNVIETVTSDHVLLQGRLRSHSDAPLWVMFRRGQPFKNTPGLTWSIYGDKGEIRLTSTAAALQASDEEVQIDLHDFAKDTIETIQVERRFTDFPVPARNVAAMYEAFADGETNKYPDFQHAMMRHRMIAEVFRSSNEDVRATYL